MSKQEQNAAEINDHLTNGGCVQITTYSRAIRYEAEHAGWFFADSKGELRVRQGNKSLVIGNAAGQMLVNIQLGRMVAK